MGQQLVFAAARRRSRQSVVDGGASWPTARAPWGDCSAGSWPPRTSTGAVWSSIRVGVVVAALARAHGSQTVSLLRGRFVHGLLGSLERAPLVRTRHRVAAWRGWVPAVRVRGVGAGEGRGPDRQTHGARSGQPAPQRVTVRRPGGRLGDWSGDRRCVSIAPRFRMSARRRRGYRVPGWRRSSGRRVVGRRGQARADRDPR